MNNKELATFLSRQIGLKGEGLADALNFYGKSAHGFTQEEIRGFEKGFRGSNELDARDELEFMAGSYVQVPGSHFKETGNTDASAVMKGRRVRPHGPIRPEWEDMDPLERMDFE